MILKKIIDAKKYKKEIIKAKIVSAEGSVPRNSGTFMLITSKYLFGSIGGGQLEYVIVDKAKKILLNKLLKKQVVNIPLGPLIGQCCGGYVQVEIEKFNNGCQSLKNEKMNIPKCSNLYIFGAGHIGQELSTRSLDLDFNVHLIDSRNEYLKLQNEDKINQIYVKYP